MSVSSESLSPRSKSTVRKAASCGHVLFLCAATSRATWCSMMAEEPLPPKPASTTSFRCKDGRSAKPYHGCWFWPKALDKNKANMEYSTTHGSKISWKTSSNDENSGRLVFQVQNCGMQEPIHPETVQWSRQSLWMLPCCELQYVLGTPLAANQQLAISRERNATSLHRIENQCANNKRFTEVGTLLLWCGPAFCWATSLSPRPATTTTNSQFGSTFSIPNTHGFRKKCTDRMLSKRKTQTNEDNVGSTTTTPTPPTVQLVTDWRFEA